MEGDESLDLIARKVQGYLGHPLVVLGSGASAALGLPTMGGLAKAICDDAGINGDSAFESLLSALRNDSFVGLEQAIDEAGLAEEQVNRIRRVVWGCVADADKSFCESKLPNMASGRADNELMVLINKILNTSSYSVTIVTTNYDRMVEYASDALGVECITGFEGYGLRKFEPESDKTVSRRFRARQRAVRLLKVHGSLDWYSDSAGGIFSTPYLERVPEGCSPLIVPPSKSKYAETHESPYREVIAQADVAFASADSFLCVGYGFGDKHIHPRMLREVQQHNKPLVIVTHTATQACREWVSSAGLKKYVLLECGCENGGTLVEVDGEKHHVGCELWSLKGLEGIW